MSVPNLSSLAGLEVAEKFVVGLWGGRVGGSLGEFTAFCSVGGE